MAGSLVLIDSVTASDDATVTLGTTDWDSSYNVYMVTLNKIIPATDNTNINARLTKASDNSVDDSSNYDRVMVELRADGSFYDYSGADSDAMFLDLSGTGTGEQVNGVAYLFNFNNASEYSFLTFENTGLDSSANLRGRQGGFVLTVAQATNGIQFYFGSGNIDSGEFKLYGLKK
tara:strand:- start:55 stop:579 length:525 start_codon:yes stop_codon:yes gene_type:complete